MQQILQLERHVSVTDVYNSMCLLHAEFSWKIASLAVRVHQAVCIYRPHKSIEHTADGIGDSFSTFQHRTCAGCQAYTCWFGKYNAESHRLVVHMVTCTSAI